MGSWKLKAFNPHMAEKVTIKMYLDRQVFLRLAENPCGKYFLKKNYSLELLLLLFDRVCVEGIEELSKSLVSPTPKAPALNAYLSLLESKNCIIKAAGDSKKSRRKILLTQSCRNSIAPIFATQD